MKKTVFAIFSISLIVSCISTSTEQEKPKDDPEVLDVLETDPIFTKLLEKYSYDEIIAGKIPHLNFINHQVRTQLDDLKRNEIQRLNILLARKRKLLNIPHHEIHNHMSHHHLDHENEGFSLKDLEKLIVQTNADLDEIDKKRRQEFQLHEMQQELERRKILQTMNSADRQQAEESHQKLVEIHKHHPIINEPGSLVQLKEVWEHQDGLIDEKFDPRTFFKLHDLNEDDLWDEFEIEALFEHELNKIFNESAAPFDPIEREEEMNRMREHVVEEMDADKDGVVSMDEFMEIAKTKNFIENDNWKSVEDELQFNEQQFQQYSSEHDFSTTTSSSAYPNTDTTNKISHIDASNTMTHVDTSAVTTNIETTTTTVTTTTETTTTTVTTTTETTTTTATTTTTIMTTTSTTVNSNSFRIRGVISSTITWISCNPNTKLCKCQTDEKEASYFSTIPVKNDQFQLNLIGTNFCLNVYGGSQNVNVWLCEGGRNSIFTSALMGSWMKSNLWYDGWINCAGDGQQLTISEAHNEWRFDYSATTRTQ